MGSSDLIMEKQKEWYIGAHHVWLKPEATSFSFLFVSVFHLNIQKDMYEA